MLDTKVANWANLKSIVTEKQALKLRFTMATRDRPLFKPRTIMVDLFTASAMVGAIERLSDEKKKAMLQENISNLGMFMQVNELCFKTGVE